MNTRRTRTRGSLTGGSLGLCLLLLATFSACGTSQDVDFDPRNARAGFALADKPTGAAEAGAIFIVPRTGLTTTQGIDSVVLVGPGNNRTVLNVETNPFNASYYRANIPEVQLNADYQFEVNFTDGTPIPNSIRTPTASLEITDPKPDPGAADLTLRRIDYLNVGWEDATTASNLVRIAIRDRNSTNYIFTVLGEGGKNVPDTGHFRGDQQNPAVLVRDAMLPNNLWSGPGYLILNRKTESGVNGFAPGSYIMGAILDWIPVDVVE